MSVDDEAIIKRRLLIDGDGTGDDRRLNVLLKTYIKWCNSSDETDNSLTVHDRILSQLAQCEFSVLKSELSTQMIEEEEINYKRVSESISTSIEMVRKQIELSKENLVAAKKIRKNKMEYDVLAKIINQQPDRSDTVKQHEVLKTELDELHEKYQKLNKMLDNRRKDFANFMNSIRELELLKDPEIEDARDLSCEAFDDLVDVSEDKMIIDE